MSAGDGRGKTDNDWSVGLRRFDLSVNRAAARKDNAGSLGAAADWADVAGTLADS